MNTIIVCGQDYWTHKLQSLAHTLPGKCFKFTAPCDGADKRCSRLCRASELSLCETIGLTKLFITQTIWCTQQVNEYGELVDRYRQGDKLVPVPFCPPQTANGLAWDRSRTSTVTSWRPTVWAITRHNMISHAHGLNGQKRRPACSLQAVTLDWQQTRHMKQSAAAVVKPLPATGIRH